MAIARRWPSRPRQAHHPEEGRLPPAIRGRRSKKYGLSRPEGEAVHQALILRIGVKFGTDGVRVVLTRTDRFLALDLGLRMCARCVHGGGRRRHRIRTPMLEAAFVAGLSAEGAEQSPACADGLSCLEAAPGRNGAVASVTTHEDNGIKPLRRAARSCPMSSNRSRGARRLPAVGRTGRCMVVVTWLRRPSRRRAPGAIARAAGRSRRRQRCRFTGDVLFVPAHRSCDQRQPRRSQHQRCLAERRPGGLRPGRRAASTPASPSTVTPSDRRRRARRHRRRRPRSRSAPATCVRAAAPGTTPWSR